MSKSEKLLGRKPKNSSPTRKQLIKSYIDLKRKEKDQTISIFRDDFVRCSPFSKRLIVKLFGSWGSFRNEAEEECYKKLPKKARALLSERSKKFDENATKDSCIDNLRLVQEENPTSDISRNFYREIGKYSDSTWSRFFGTFQEFRRQAGIELTRHQHKLEREVAKHASYDNLREFFRTEVLPFHNKFDKFNSNNNRYKTILVGSDFHDVDCDEFVLSVFIDTARRLQPDVIVLNGDLFDLYDCSKYSKDLRQLKIVERFDFVKRNIFKPLRELCPNTQIDFILGNHEWRLLNLLSDKTPNLKVILADVMGLSLADVFGLDEFQINMVCKLDLTAFTKTDMKNELRQNYRVYYDCFVAGHFKDLGYGMSGTSGHCHRPATITFTNLIMGKCSWVETGCMCITDAEYVPHRSKWTNSFLIAHIDAACKSVSPEHIIVPYDNVVIHGVRYEREGDSAQFERYNGKKVWLPDGIKKS